MVFTNTYINTWMMFCASLTYNNIAGFGNLSAIYLHAQTFTVRFSTVTGTARAFFVCYGMLKFLSFLKIYYKVMSSIRTLVNS